MVVGIKDSLKLFGVSIICCCAILICTMFLNYAIDLRSIANEVTTPEAQVFYNAQLTVSKIVIIVTGLCLFATSIVTLLFHVKHFIDTHKKDLGILKAIGYSNAKIASSFVIFGLSVFVGAAIGFGIAYAIMPTFYNIQNEDGILPNFSMQFHAEILVYFVVLPSVVFAFLAVIYAYYKLKQPTLGLLKESGDVKRTKRMHDISDKTPFLRGLAYSTLKNKKVLAFFIWFSSFCFATMIQMGASMRDLASSMMAAMMMTIGILLAVVTLVLAVTTVVKANIKAIAILRAYGYNGAQCTNAIIGCYRPFAYFGFIIGTVYQYAILLIMVEVVFKDLGDIYKFDFAVMAITLAVFIVAYEGLTFVCSEGIKRISLKRIMTE